MPIDPSIPLSVQHPQMMSLADLQHMRLQQQTGQQQLQIGQQQIASNQALEAERRDELARKQRVDQQTQTINQLVQKAFKIDPDTGVAMFDRPTLEQAMVQSGNFDRYPAMVEHIDRMEESSRKMAAERRTTIARTLVGITEQGNKPGDLLAGAAFLKANGAVTDDHLQSVLQALGPDDSPEAVGALVDKLGSGLPEYRDLRNAEAKRKSDLAHVNAETTHLTSQARKADADAALVLSGGKPEHSPAFKEWQDYQSQGGKLDFNAYQTEDANRKRPVTNINAGGTAAGLDADGLELAATAYRLTKALPARNAQQNGAIITQAAKQAKALGNSPVATIQKQAAYKGDSAALNKMQSMSAAAEAFETKANAQVALVSDLSKKVGRTDWPIVNDLLLSGKAATGDTDTHLFSNALLTFSNEYAKIMEGSTGSSAGSSESARRDAAKLISTGLNNGTIQKTLQQMQWEMRQTLLGYDTVIGHINERLGGSAPGQTNTVVPPPGGAPQQKPIPGIAGGIAESTDGGQTWHRVK